MNSFALGRLVLFAVLVPLAVVLGYLLSTPFSYTTLVVVGMVFAVLTLPVVLKWHHLLLIFSWNASIEVFFLPGKPQLWFFLSVVGLGIALLKRGMLAEYRFCNVRSINICLLFLAAVVLTTALLRGGIGVRVLGGSTYGGRGYFYIIGAIIGYFALTAERIPLDKAKLFINGYFLTSLTAMVSNLIYLVGPKAYFLYLLFPAGTAHQQAQADFEGPMAIQRLSGFAPTATGICFFILARFGLKGTFSFRHPWRAGVIFLALAVGAFSGFRSTFVIFGLMCSILFFLEGLHKTRAVAWVVAGVLMVGVVLVPLASHLPLSVQRSLSFIPLLPLDQVARQDALGSTEWRIQMWQVLVPQISEYFWLGKGYALDPAALYLAEQGMIRGLFRNYEVALVAGDYHSGPLSLIIPFGIWGVLAFVTFLLVGIRVLYMNYRYGDPHLKAINTFLLAFFLMRSFFFFVLFGAFNAEMFLFTGTLGLSVALNGGVSKASAPVTPHAHSRKSRELLSPILSPTVRGA